MFEIRVKYRSYKTV